MVEISPGNQSDHSYWLKIIKSNKGFDKPELWTNFASKHHFKKREADYFPECPECSGQVGKVVGQYIHFSQLVRIRKCPSCELIYSDVLLKPAFMKSYFEKAYKDDFYFDRQRQLIFKHLVETISRYFDSSFKAIDIGGAKGHLARFIQSRFPQSEVTVSDISEQACEYAANTFLLKTICCRLEELKNIDKQYNLILLIDLLYYIPDIRAAWETIAEITSKGGILILRLPNKIYWILLWQKFRKLFFSMKKQHKIAGMNPEHIRFFTTAYLKRRIRKSGFVKLTFYPSPPLVPVNKIKRLLVLCYWHIANLIYKISLGNLVITPGLLAVAHKK